MSTSLHFSFRHPSDWKPVACDQVVVIDPGSNVSCNPGGGSSCFEHCFVHLTFTAANQTPEPGAAPPAGSKRTPVTVDGVSGVRSTWTESGGQCDGCHFTDYTFTASGGSWDFQASAGADDAQQAVFDLMVSTVTFAG